jgi:hypothetical protein
MDVFHTGLWAIGLLLEVTSEKRHPLQRHWVKMVAIFTNIQAASLWWAHQKSGPRERLTRQRNRSANAILANVIEFEIHWVPGHSGIAGHKESDRQMNVAWDFTGDTDIEGIYTSACNMAREICKGWFAANTHLEAIYCRKYISYRLKGKAGAEISIPMRCVNSLATGFYRLKTWHTPT